MNLSTEPVAIGTLINALFAAAIAVAVGFFGFNPDEAQLTALASLQGLLIMVIGFLVRQKVSPVNGDG